MATQLVLDFAQFDVGKIVTLELEKQRPLLLL
jgi:hypothetical protein